MIYGNQMGKKRNIQPPPIIPGRIKVEIKDEIGNYVGKYGNNF